MNQLSIFDAPIQTEPWVMPRADPVNQSLIDWQEAKSKTVTRRFGWWFLKPGDRVWAVEKAMGLKKGESVKKLVLLEVVSTRIEPLDAITKADCVAEGFPKFEPADFVKMLTDHYRCPADTECNRIEFRYVD